MRKISALILLCASLSMNAESLDSSTSSAPDGDLNGHEYVDLGLPSGTLWATCNIGAESPYHSGLYFAWGETKSRELFKWHDYEFFEEEYTDDEGSLNYTATDIGDDITGTEYDAARCQWGDGWRIPTMKDWEELQSYCHMEYRKESGFYDNNGIRRDEGLRIWGPNGNSILLPVTFSPHAGTSTAVLKGEYWSATAYPGESEQSYPLALEICFNPSDPKLESFSNGRHDGLSIRPVLSRENTDTYVSAILEEKFELKYSNGSILISGYSHADELRLSDLAGRHVWSSHISDNICQLPRLGKGLYVASLYRGSKALSSIKLSIK